ncbi:HutD family protein [Streptococcus cristatus]|uniref:HutD/Ves family protein n=1 Tax=Streptococcus cristatus TaxID=45634 RepID=UPI001EF3B385|nr:HutD family protein [Streptococcus cristatus]MCG7330872.1 HutD family protein [Streptococcus cristatus]
MTNISLLRANDFQVSDWSGGKTKQLYLSPPTGHYGKREFDYRLSTATVEAAESEFSDLSGFHRILMSLDHTLYLHNASRQEETVLAPFTPYFFEGSDSITSRGTCTDFNLIYSDHYQGQMLAISDREELSQDEAIQFIYALSDLMVTGTGLPSLNLETGQLLIVEKEAQETELQIMFSSNQPTGAPLAIWAGLTHIPTK